MLLTLLISPICFCVQSLRFAVHPESNSSVTVPSPLIVLPEATVDKKRRESGIETIATKRTTSNQQITCSETEESLLITSLPSFYRHLEVFQQYMKSLLEAFDNMISSDSDSTGTSFENFLQDNYIQKKRLLNQNPFSITTTNENSTTLVLEKGPRIEVKNTSKVKVCSMQKIRRQKKERSARKRCG
jgi:hypothetical protein